MSEQFIHVKNLEKYHPGYKDRTLQWAKIYFKMVQGDPDCELIDSEIDWARLLKFILLELEAQQPIPLNNKYLAKKGFDLKKRSIALTLNMLHKFVCVVTEDLKLCGLDKDKDKDKEIDKEEKSKSKIFEQPTFAEVSEYIKEKGYEIDPDKWYNHYTANGWKVGKNKMSDWKAGVRTWIPEKETKKYGLI